MNASRKRTKVVLIISHVDKSVGFEWLVENIDRSLFDLSFILLNDKPSYLAGYLTGHGIRVDELTFHGKLDIPFLILKVMRILRTNRPDVIHTHLFGANLIGHIAGRILGIKKRIYTRHSSNENRKYHNKQRIDHLVNSLVTHIIAISENVKNVLVNEENVKPEKIRLLHHGFDLERFSSVTDDELASLTAKYNPDGKRPVIGVIARYSHWKGIQFAIPAFKKLLGDYPNALLILANAKRGDYAKEIAALLAELPESSFCEIEFEHNLFALYHLFDVYVHVPIDAELEAFGQTYVEALAAGIPSVFTLSGVAPEFIQHERNALIVDFQNPDQVYESARRLLEDDELRMKLSEAGKADVRSMFSFEMMIRRLEKIYSE